MVGETEGFEIEEVNPAGLADQLYVFKALPVVPILTEFPWQIVKGRLVVSIGKGFMVMIAESLFAQPLLVSVR